MKKVIVTGASGFIGHSVIIHLIKSGIEVIGIDNLNDYYSVSIKKDRLKFIKSIDSSNLFKFFEFDISESNYIEDDDFLSHTFNCDAIIHLAAQAGVRYSIEAPQTYIDFNITGFLNIITLAKKAGIHNITYASSSSVYGNNPDDDILKLSHRADKPVSLYAATKRMNELMASVFQNIDNINFAGLRYFTVYGPFGRPDMALYKFTKNILNGDTIDVYNEGKHERDFTYIEDISIGTIQATKYLLNQSSFNKVYNLASSKPVKLIQFIQIIEEKLGRKAIINFLPMQKGDVLRTYGDITSSEKDFAYKPSIGIEEGVSNFIDWFKEYHEE